MTPGYERHEILHMLGQPMSDQIWAALHEVCGAFHTAPERTRTSTDHSVHKALSLKRPV
jgi:hypothetical protein